MADSTSNHALSMSDHNPVLLGRHRSEHGRRDVGSDKSNIDGTGRARPAGLQNNFPGTAGATGDFIHKQTFEQTVTPQGSGDCSGGSSSFPPTPSPSAATTRPSSTPSGVFFNGSSGQCNSSGVGQMPSSVGGCQMNQAGCNPGWCGPMMNLPVSGGANHPALPVSAYMSNNLSPTGPMNFGGMQQQLLPPHMSDVLQQQSPQQQQQQLPQMLQQQQQLNMQLQATHHQLQQQQPQQLLDLQMQCQQQPQQLHMPPSPQGMNVPSMILQQQQHQQQQQQPISPHQQQQQPRPTPLHQQQEGEVNLLGSGSLMPMNQQPQQQQPQSMPPFMMHHPGLGSPHGSCFGLAQQLQQHQQQQQAPQVPPGNCGTMPMQMCGNACGCMGMWPATPSKVGPGSNNNFNFDYQPAFGNATGPSSEGNEVGSNNALNNSPTPGPFGKNSNGTNPGTNVSHNATGRGKVVNNTTKGSFSSRRNDAGAAHQELQENTNTNSSVNQRNGSSNANTSGRGGGGAAGRGLRARRCLTLETAIEHPPRLPLAGNHFGEVQPQLAQQAQQPSHQQLQQLQMQQQQQQQQALQHQQRQPLQPQPTLQSQPSGNPNPGFLCHPSLNQNLHLNPQNASQSQGQNQTVLSQGSLAHDGTGRCSPCAWFWKPKGCSSGISCNYCHACPEGELKQRKKAKIAALRLAAAKSRSH